MISINIIGAGKLGKKLGYTWHKHQLGPINGVCSTSKEHSLEAIQWMGDGVPISDVRAMPHADLTFITVPDVLIQHLCELWIQSPAIQPGDMVVHCSGALSSTILKSAENRQCLTASIHPMSTFAQALSYKDYFSGIYCAMEGHEKILKRLEALFYKVGAIPFMIQTDKKSTYHAAGVFASNYLITLINQSIECLKKAGISEELAKNISLSIAGRTLENLSHQSVHQSLTGPLQRGDIATIQSHLEVLNPQERVLYQTLGLATLSITSLSLEKIEYIQKLFQDR